MLLLYSFSVRIYYLFIVFFSFLGNKKAKAWIQGRQNGFEKLQKAVLDVKGSKIVWFHCASLGEFEQGKPLMERFLSDYPQYKLFVSFFSPSGYEVRRDYEKADYVFYLPLDTSSNAKKLLSILKPEMVFFIKYEFWYFLLQEIYQSNIKHYLVSANFRENHIFFKSYGSLYRKILRQYHFIFVQNKKSLDLLHRISIENALIAGDTRFDRVSMLAKESKSIPLIEEFKGNHLLLIIGSCWPGDLAVLIPFIKRFDKALKVMIAPHEIHESEIKQLISKLNKTCILFTDLQKAGKIQGVPDVLIMDKVGFLAQSYLYADFAYVGGGFGEGLHNILEPAAFGAPVIFGKDYKDFPEAEELIGLGTAFSIKDSSSLEEVFQHLYHEDGLRNKIKELNQEFVRMNKGGVDKIMDYLKNQ